MGERSPPPPQKVTGQRDVGAVVHAIGILRYLSTATVPLGVAAIARGTGISVSTCFNILRTLTRARYVSFHEKDKTYALGLAVAELAAGLLGMSHAELIRPELQQLALKYEMIIVLWRVTEDGHIVLIDRAYSPAAVRVEMAVGIRLPMLVGAVGRCVAAALALEKEELRRRFSALRWQSPPSFEDYWADVQQAQESGWSIDSGHLYRGLTTIAALVKDQESRPRFGISGITITAQYDPALSSQLGAELRELAELTGKALFPRPLPNAE